MKRVCVTGGAGFIGSNLVDRLSADGVEVVILDNFRTGRREFVADALRRPQVRLVEGDVLDAAALDDAFEGCEWVFHLQANADVREGFEHPRCDLEQNTLATAGVLEAMRARGVSRIAFTSTGSVYGEPEVFPTPEDAPFPIQTSLYGASKRPARALIAAYAAGYGFTGVICRLVSILGERYTHGHLFDFYRALRRDPTRLRVLGDGRQEKSYLYVHDCLDAMLCAVERHREEPGAHIYNLGLEETDLGRGLDRPPLRAPRAHAAHRAHRRAARVDRRQPPHPPRHGSHFAASAGSRGSRSRRRRCAPWSGSTRTSTPGTSRPASGRASRRASPPGGPPDEEGTSEMAVIFSRAPLRISLGGGGTDLPSYYAAYGGFLVSGAIDKYVYMLTHTVFQRRYRMKYSELEEVDDVSQIRHPILRECLLRHWRGAPLEIASVADVPAGTGMGSSGAYTVCLLKGLARARYCSISPGDLAEAACEIEMGVLGEPVGKQDPYVAAHGGICAYTFHPDGSVEVTPLELDPAVLRRLRDQLLLFYTGEARSASKVLADQDARSKQGDEQMIENLHRTKDLGHSIHRLLEEGDLEGYAALMHEHWEHKRRRSPGHDQ